MRYFLFFLAISGLCHAAPKQIRVFVALCDNKTQGIVPVGEKIGNGDDPDANLYWGCTDGLAAHFRKSGNSKQVRSEKDGSKELLRRLTFRHTAAHIGLVADAQHRFCGNLSARTRMTSVCVPAGKMCTAA